MTMSVIGGFSGPRARAARLVASLPFLLAAADRPRDGHPRPDPLPAPDEYTIRAFGIANGLPSSDVQDLVQGADGYLYVAGLRLARFDGRQFLKVDLSGVRSPFTVMVFRDSRGRLWLRSSTNEVAYLEDEHLTVLPSTRGSITSMSETSDGAVWLGGVGGVRRATAGTPATLTTFGTADGLPSAAVGSLYDLPGGDRVASTARGFARIVADASRPGGIRFVAIGPADSLALRSAALAVADSSGLWVETNNGQAVLRYHDGMVTRYRPGGGSGDVDLDRLAWSPARSAEWAMLWWRSRDARDARARAGLADHTLHPLRLTRDGAEWFSARAPGSASETLVRLRDRRFETIALISTPRFTVIRTVLEDREGSVWVGTDRGLFQLARRKIFPITRVHGLADDFTAPVLQTRDGAVWVGTWGGGLHRFSDGQLSARWDASRLLSDQIRSLYEAADGTLWIGGRHLVASMRDGRVQFQQRVAQEGRAFSETRDGRLWIAAGNALFVRTPHGLLADRPAFWSDKSIWALHATGDGALWVGAEGGLFRLTTDSLRAFGAADGLTSTFITSIHEAANGALWFGTYEDGLVRYRNGHFATLTTRDGLPADGIWRMLDDGRGGVWMSSDHGIFRIDAARLDAAADRAERGDHGAMHLDPLVFTESDGMPTRECNRASPGGWRLADGRLVFNNAGGLAIIDPVRATADVPLARTIITHVFADGDSLVAGGASVTLPAGVKQIAVDFTTLSYLAPNQTLYRYRLDGYDDDWVQGGQRPRAVYTALAPGSYTFRVQGRNSGTATWGDAESSLVLDVQSFFWQTIWFRVALALAVAALLTLAYRYRVARLLEMERLRLRIASDLHDDVGSSLSSIALLSGMLARRRRADDGGLEQRQLQRIQQAAHETIGALRDIIWIVHPDHDRLDDLLQKMRSIASNALPDGIGVIDIPDAEPVRLRIALVRNVLLIYKEALHNATRHASASRITVAVRVQQRMLTVDIHDDGAGFEPSSNGAGHGIANMRRRATEIGAALAITSAPGTGTRITLSARIA